MNKIEWVYSYDENGNRTGLVDSHKGLTECKKHLTPPFSSAWFWGNPLLEKSFSDHLIGDNYGVLRGITSVEFGRTFTRWVQEQTRLMSSNSELVQVMRLERYAKQHGIKSVQSYIASKLNTNQQQISRLLRLASLELMEDELTNFAYMGETSYCISEGQLHDWYPPKKEIEHKAASIPRICSVGYDGCKGTTQNGKLAICYTCHKRLKQNNMLDLLPDWVVSEESRIRREHYNEAVNACFEDHYGTVGVSEQLSYLDAI